MKRFIILAAAPLMASCAVLPAISAVSSVVQAVAVNRSKVVIPATQALIIAHNAYQSAAAAATLGVETGVIKGANLDLVAKYNDEAKMLLDKADAGQDIAANSAGVMNLVTRIHSLLTGK